MNISQRGFISLAFVVLVAVIAGTVGYFALHKSATAPIESPTVSVDRNVLPQTNPPDNLAASLGIYRNNIYGFEIKYPLAWVLRDGSKDYKSAGLDNFYQFCDKVIAASDGIPSPGDNFVGRCEGELLRINIWAPTVEMKTVTSDFETLKFNRENKITIGGKPASEFIYSGPNQVSGGTHTWHLFVVQTSKYTYSMSGDSCMDDKKDCNQILSNFKFIQN